MRTPYSPEQMVQGAGPRPRVRRVSEMSPLPGRHKKEIQQVFAGTPPQTTCSFCPRSRARGGESGGSAIEGRVRGGLRTSPGSPDSFRRPPGRALWTPALGALDSCSPLDSCSLLDSCSPLDSCSRCRTPLVHGNTECSFCASAECSLGMRSAHLVVLLLLFLWVVMVVVVVLLLLLLPLVVGVGGGGGDERGRISRVYQV